MSSKIRVLHVDDDDDIRVITKLAFSLDDGFELEQCSSGAEALEKARVAPPDLLLLDMVMPGMDGAETWERMKSECGLSETPAIFMSARAEQEFARKLLEKGATAVITKPFDPMTLCTQIREALEPAKGRGPAQTDNLLRFTA
jgi:CheY-like chemotaxis protein